MSEGCWQRHRWTWSWKCKLWSDCKRLREAYHGEVGPSMTRNAVSDADLWRNRRLFRDGHDMIQAVGGWSRSVVQHASRIPAVSPGVIRSSSGDIRRPLDKGRPRHGDGTVIRGRGSIAGAGDEGRVLLRGGLVARGQQERGVRDYHWMTGGGHSGGGPSMSSARRASSFETQ